MLSERSVEGAVIRRDHERGRARTPWLDAKHSFNFGRYQQPGNSHFGLLVVFNDDIVQPGAGFTRHSHRDLEIVTWPLAGRVEHRDSTGISGELEPGHIQQMTAGRGIAHSEMNPSDDEPARWVQMWVLPDTPDLSPSYQDLDVSASLSGGELIPIVGRRQPDALLDHHQRDAVLWAGWLPPARTVTLPEAPFLHLYVASGAVDIEQVGRLDSGDAARLSHCGERRLTVSQEDNAEVLVWEMHKHLAH